jgi:hypothetical protein
MVISLRGVIAATSFLAISTGMNAQSFERRASMRGDGNRGSGKCTIEVVVDGAADVQVRGDSAILTNLRGQPPQWRRFECNGVMPPNPAGFRFQGIDGRGRQTLIRDPRNGGSAVVRIEDPDNGSEGYTFDLIWNSGGGPYTNQYPQRPDFEQDRGRDGRYDRRFTADQAVQVCQDEVRRQAAERFRTNDVTFRRANIDDGPGRNDWVVGTMEVRQPYQPDQIVKFSCSVNFENGRVRTAQIEPLYSEGGRRGLNPIAVEKCQRAVEQRVRRDGYDRLSFGPVTGDSRLVGEFRAVGRYGPEDFRFSCVVDPRDGDVRSLDVTTRR